MNHLIYLSAREEQLESIFAMYESAIKDMIDNHIYQWDEIYPDKDILREDILKNELTIALKDKDIVAAYVLNTECDEEYKYGKWKYPNASYKVIHRLCVSSKFQHQGIAKQVMLHIEEVLKKQEIESIRLDAFPQNPYALKLYEALEYKITGHANWRKGRFYLMEKKIE